MLGAKIPSGTGMMHEKIVRKAKTEILNEDKESSHNVHSNS